jgi:hypothetical protein
MIRNGGPEWKRSLEILGAASCSWRSSRKKSDDIERVEILAPKVSTVSGQRLDFSLALHTAGQQYIISRKDAEVVLNDGILNRMGIKIEFQKVK